MKWSSVYLSLGMVALIFMQGGSAPTGPAPTITYLPMTAPERVEFSSLTWIGDTLLLLPEKPDRFREQPGSAGGFFTLRKQDILDALDGRRVEPLTPTLVKVDGSAIWPTTQSWNVTAAGFEGAALDGNTLYLLIESESMNADAAMRSFLVKATLEPDLSAFHLDLTAPIELPQQAHFYNLSYESLTLVGQQLMALYEVNSQPLNPTHAAILIDPQTRAIKRLPLPEIGARVTDVTPPNAHGVLWALSCCLLGEALLAEDFDLIAKQYGLSALTAPLHETVQLVPLRATNQGIVVANEPTISTAWTDQTPQENWEGIAPLDDRGFLIVTDQYPKTLLGFIAVPPGTFGP